MSITYYYNQGTAEWLPLMDINVPAHNDTTSLQGGTAGQYYHLTAAQNTNLGTVTAAGWALLDDATAAVQATTLGLGTTNSPEFTSIKLSALTDGYVPYRKADTDLLANSPVFTDGTNVGIGTATPVSALAVAGTTGITWGWSDGKGLVTIGDMTTGGSLFVRTPSLSDWPSGFGVTGTYGTPAYRSVINLNAYGVPSVGTEYGSDMAFSTSRANVLTERMRIDMNGNVGIGTSAPVAKFHVTDGSANYDPSLTYNAIAGAIINNASVDLAMGVASTSPYAYWLQARNISNISTPISLNPLGGNVGIGTTAPASKLSINGGLHVGGDSDAGDNNILADGTITAASTVITPKAHITTEGGFAVRLTAGENLTRGEVVYVKIASGADGKVWKTPTSNDMPIGIVFADASANAEVVVITSGIAYVLPESGITAARGNVIFTSDAEAGRVDQSATVPTTEHWREVGHFLDTGSGNGAITRALIHFN